jgi:hypothetical protein
MKKIFYLFCASLLLHTSCSSDDSTVNIPVPILPKTISYIFPYISHRNYTKTITYNGNKIVSIYDSRGEKETYTYTGNLITKVVVTDVLSAEIITTNTFTYKDSNISTQLFTQDIHNSPPIEYVYSKNSQFEDWISCGEVRYIFVNGNLTKKSIGDCMVTYEYDTKNSPFRNITGFKELLYSSADTFSTQYNVCVNNLLKVTSVCYEGYPNSSTSTFNYKYEYNSDNCPIKITSEDVIIEYTY